MRDPDDRVDIERRGTAKAFEQGGPLQLAEFGENFGVAHVRRQQARILQDLGLHAAKADEDDRSPIRIVAAADDQLDAARAHRLDQHAVER